MARRQPEGKIKDECRKIAERHNLLFWQIEGKQRNGVPDTVAGKLLSKGVVFLEFKVPGKQPTEQQWLRIHDLREAGQDAWWCDSVDTYRRLVGLRGDPFEPFDYTYPAHIQALLDLGTVADDI